MKASRSTAEALRASGILPKKGTTREKRTRAGGSRKTDLPGQIVKYLNGLPGVWACRVHSGKVKLAPEYGGYWMHLAPEGTPDVLGRLPDGRMLAVECKEGKGRATTMQRHTIDEHNRNGALAFVARSRDDVEEALRREGVI